MKLFRVSLLSLMFWIPLNLFSQSLIQKEVFSLKDDREKWKIGITSFQDKGITPDQSYLLKSIPIMLYRQLSLCQTHQLTQPEIKYLARTRIDSEIILKKKEFSKLQKEMDRLFFDRNVSANKRREKQNQITKLYLEIEKLKLFSKTPEQVIVEKEKPIDFIITSDESPLLPRKNQSPQQIIDDNKLDMLVTGVVEQVEGLIYYKIELYSRLSEEPILFKLNGGEYNKITEKVKLDSSPFITSILGHEWANLVLEIWPLTAVIHFNDGFKGVGIISRNYLLPDEYIVRVDAPGYIAEELQINLKSTENFNFKLTMQKDLNYPVVIQSFPAKADVYLSSQWVGKTPMLIENAGLDEPFVVRKEGYSDFYGTIEQQELALHSLTLFSSEFMTDDLLELKRDDLYDSLTMMAVGIPFFLFGFGYGDKYTKLIGGSNVSASISPVNGSSFNKNYYDLSTANSGMTILNEIGLTIFSASIVNLFVDMVQYVELYDNM